MDDLSRAPLPQDRWQTRKRAALLVYATSPKPIASKTCEQQKKRARAWLGALRDLDLQLLRVDQELRRHAKAPAGHLIWQLTHHII